MAKNRAQKRSSHRFEPCQIEKKYNFFYCFFFSVIALNFILLVGAFVLNITITIFSVI